jgi:hypothetical protein
MESELWRAVYARIQAVARGQHPKGATFSDAEIAGTYLWSVRHDRPVFWACQRTHWPIWWRRRRLPTPSTMSRRLRTAAVQAVLAQVEGRLVAERPASVCRWIDAKPLPIGSCSADPEAGWGRAAASMAKGYKVYTVADPSQGFVAWTIRPMNVNEQKAAEELIERLEGEGYLVGDGAYDSNRLYDQAGQKAIQLLAPPRAKRQGLGHIRHSPYRLRALELQRGAFGQALLESRDQIERMFGHLTNPGFGLGPLPNWVRRRHRVELWVRGKMIFYHLSRLLKSPHVA